MLANKNFAIVTFIGIILGVFAAFCFYKWKVSKDIYFTPSILQNQNPFFIEKEVKRCTILKGTVSNFIFSGNAIELKVNGVPNNWHFQAYLSKKQLQEIKLDQEVTVRGIFRIEMGITSVESTNVYIGSAISNPFYSTKAKIIS